jgi:antitoxin CptB
LSAAAGIPGRLAWRCRRGMKELDLVLMRYLEHGWQQAGEVERGAFERLLELPDPMLVAMLLSGEPAADPGLRGVVARIRAS